MTIEKFENEGIYEFRLIPNVSNPSKYCITKRIRSTERVNNPPIELNFSYILMNNEIKHTILPRPIMKIVSALMKGTEIFINDENIVLNNSSNSEVKYYSFTENRDIILHEEDVDGEYELFNDINILFDEPTNLYNITKGYRILMNMKKIQGFKHFYDIKIFTDVEPLYKEGVDKNLILNMYNDVSPLEDTVEEYISDMLGKYPSLTVI